MVRQYYVNGESLVLVKGAVGSEIATLSELGLADSPITITQYWNHLDITVNAYGQAPPEIQWMNGWATITMRLVHFDPTVMDICARLSMGGAPAIGTVGRAGALMGNGVADPQPHPAAR